MLQYQRAGSLIEELRFKDCNVLKTADTRTVWALQCSKIMRQMRSICDHHTFSTCPTKSSDTAAEPLWLDTELMPLVACLELHGPGAERLVGEDWSRQCSRISPREVDDRGDSIVEALAIAQALDGRVASTHEHQSAPVAVTNAHEPSRRRDRSEGHVERLATR